MIMRGFGGMGGFGWIGAIIGLALCVAIIVVVVLLTIYAVRRLSRSRSGTSVMPQGPVTPPLQTPKEILQARYARGEITREQYMAMLEDIK